MLARVPAARTEPPGTQKPRPGHDSWGNLLAGVAARFIRRSAVLSGSADAVRVARRVNARRAGHVNTTFARWPAIEVRRDWPWSPAELGALVTRLFTVEPERVLRPATLGTWLRVAVRLWRLCVSAHRYVRIVGAVYVRLVVICTTTAAPRCRVPVPNPRAKKLSCSG